jgi:hypothetical protein
VKRTLETLVHLNHNARGPLDGVRWRYATHATATDRSAGPSREKGWV